MECPPLAEDMVTCMCVGEAKVRDKVSGHISARWGITASFPSLPVTGE